MVLMESYGMMSGSGVLAGIPDDDDDDDGEEVSVLLLSFSNPPKYPTHSW